MFFGKKEEKAKLPDLPPLPALPPNDVRPVAVSPAFPDSPERRSGYSGAMSPPGRNDVYLNGPQPMTERKVVEMEEWPPQNPRYGSSALPSKENSEQEDDSYDMGMPALPSASRASESEEVEEELLPPKPRELSQLPSPRGRYVQQKSVKVVQAQPIADVFVRIDKFHNARKSLSEIKNRLHDMDELVKRIRETKLKEEQELASWEKELLHIKERVQTVSDNIFEKVE